MTDTRPLHSLMPAEAAAIGLGVVDQLKPLLDAAFDQVKALPGKPAERMNDALSITATIGAFVAQQLTAQIMVFERVGLNIAFPIAMHEIHQRAAAELLGVLERGGRGL